MGTGLQLGEFEQVVLLAILRLKDDAYGASIGVEIAACTQREPAAGALYTTLDRLEDKGLVRWKSGPGTPARNGLPRRVYAVTPGGLVALRASRKTLQRMWHGLEHLLEDPR